MEAACREAVDASSDDGLLRTDAAGLLGLWAWVLGHPESARSRDAQRAVQLGQLAVSWEPDQPAHFLHLARAWMTLAQYDLARLALEKASLMDPDDPWLLAVQRQLAELSPPVEDPRD